MVAEALALEVPVVASRISGTSDILVDEFTGNMYEPGDDAGAAALLKRVLEDPVGARQWAASARAMIRERFNSHSMRDALLDAYSRTAGAGRQRGARPKASSASGINRGWASEKRGTVAE
jgi:glycogen(starch) synthase